MYERVRDEISARLVNNFSKEDSEKVLEIFDRVFVKYDIVAKETGLVPYNYQAPILMQTFLNCKKLEGLSQLTLDGYKSTLTSLFECAQKSPSEITTDDIRNYLYIRKEGTDTLPAVKDATLAHFRSQISSFFNWMVADGYIETNPTNRVGKIKAENKPREALTLEQYERLIACPMTERDKAIIKFMFSTGCRVAELVGLQFKDISSEPNSAGEYNVHLFGKGKKHRTSFCDANAMSALKEYESTRTDDCPYVFVSCTNKQLTRETVWRILKDIERDNKLDFEIHPHKLRHTAATHAINSGMSLEQVQDMLGHASPTTTRIYAEVNKEKIEKAHGVAFAYGN